MKPAGYLLDENLSPRLKAGFDPHLQVVHARDLGENPSDLALWTYATDHLLVQVAAGAP